MRRRRLLAIGLFFLALAAFAGYVAWAIKAGARAGFDADGLRAAWPYLVAGVLTVGAVIAGFVRLAFYSSDRGYDERARTDRE